MGLSLLQCVPNYSDDYVYWEPSDLDDFISVFGCELLLLDVKVVGGFSVSPNQPHKDLDLLVPKENLKLLVDVLKMGGVKRIKKVKTQYGFSTEMCVKSGDSKYGIDIFEK